MLAKLNYTIRMYLHSQRIALVIALAIGLVYASHHFFIPAFFLDLHSVVYEPITRTDYGDEVLLYAPRAHDAFLNFGVRGDFSLAEYPHSPAMLSMLNPLLLGGIGKILGSIHAGIIVSDIIFPSAIFFIVYLLLCELGIGMYGSLFFSTIFVMAPQFGISIPPIYSFHLRTLASSIFPFLTKSESLYFSHFDEPKLTFVFLVFFIYAVMRALKYMRLGDTVIAGISFGILFYTYLFDWGTCAVSLGLMALFFLVTKDYRRFKIIAAISGIGIGISSYYWINLFMLKNISSGKDVILRLGGEFSHHIRLSTVWKSYARAIALAILLWIYARKQAKEGVIAIAAILLSYIVVVNEQAITGFNVQPDHWYRVQFLVISISIFFLVFLLWQRIAGVWTKKFVRGACLLYIGYALAAMLAGQYVYSRDKAHIFSFPIPYAKSFDWLEKNTEANSVVGTFPFEGNVDVELHTKNKIFLPFGLSTIAPDKELWQRYMIMAALWDTDIHTFASISEGGNANYLFGDEYGDHTFDANFLGYQWHIPDNVMIEKTKEYTDMLHAKGSFILPYRLDYLFVDKQKSPLWKEPHRLLPALKKVYENERVMIFSVR